MKIAATEEMPFVKNGSRDRWGNLRKNVGGRPRKMASAQNQKQISPNKSIGNQKKRIEFSAAEKVKMLDRIHQLEQDCLVKIPGDSQRAALQREQMRNQLAKQEMPALQNKKQTAFRC